MAPVVSPQSRLDQAVLSARPPLRASVYRGRIAESVHVIYAAEADSRGRLTASAGDPYFVTTMRSAAKPLQAIPALTLPGADSIDLTDEEVAICCASHPGQPRHAALAASVLALSGYLPDNLVCGGDGHPSSPLRHGCSGNHAAILLAARLLGAPLEGYERSHHPAQREIRRVIAELSGDPEPAVAVDGCGVPTFGLSLVSMARAFANLTLPGAPWERIPRAMGAFPELIGPDHWVDVPLMEVTRGRIVAKTGAEGLVCMAMAGEGSGAVLKVIDGSPRAQGAATIAWLLRRGWLSSEEAEDPRLAAVSRPVIEVNGEPVGHIEVEDKP